MTNAIETFANEPSRFLSLPQEPIPGQPSAKNWEEEFELDLNRAIVNLPITTLPWRTLPSERVYSYEYPSMEEGPLNFYCNVGTSVSYINYFLIPTRRERIFFLAMETLHEGGYFLRTALVKARPEWFKRKREEFERRRERLKIRIIFLAELPEWQRCIQNMKIVNFS